MYLTEYRSRLFVGTEDIDYISIIDYILYDFDVSVGCTGPWKYSRGFIVRRLIWRRFQGSFLGTGEFREEFAALKSTLIPADIALTLLPEKGGTLEKRWIERDWTVQSFYSIYKVSTPYNLLFNLSRIDVVHTP